MEQPLLVLVVKDVFSSALMLMGSAQSKSQKAPVFGGSLNLLISFKSNFYINCILLVLIALEKFHRVLQRIYY